MQMSGFLLQILGRCAISPSFPQPSECHYLKSWGYKIVKTFEEYWIFKMVVDFLVFRIRFVKRKSNSHGI
jgi:hypothetical protein